MVFSNSINKWWIRSVPIVTRTRSKVAQMRDVEAESLADWEVLVYEAATETFYGRKIEEIWALDYKWVRDASTNTPALVSWTWAKWDYYKVSVKWTTTIDGVSDREVGDLVLFNWTVRQRIAWGDSYVDLFDNQTVWWVKTFTLSPIVPTPANPTEVSNKDYTDSQAIAMSIALW